MIKILLGIAVLVAIIGGYFLYSQKKTAAISNFEECAVASNVILESYPAQCRTKDGRSFIQEIGNELEFTDLITVSNPRPNQAVTSPLQLAGNARGSWFFEATAPVIVTDENGSELGQGFITAQGEWMTTDFLPYEGSVIFSPSSTSTGWMIFSNSNPSGLPENSKQLKIPIKYY